MTTQQDREELIYALRSLAKADCLMDGMQVENHVCWKAAALLADGKAGGDVVAWMREGWGPDCGPYVEYCETAPDFEPEKWKPLYTRHQPAQVAQPLTKLTSDQVYEIWKRTETDNRFVFADEIMDEMLAAHGIGKDQP